jgi:hypothetical protein
MAQSPHSDLRVAPSSVEAGNATKHMYYAPENHYANNTHKVAFSPTKSREYGYGPNSNAMVHGQDQSRMICGLRKRTFWIIAIVALIILVAVIGGGVGGALALKKSDTKAEATQGTVSAGGTTTTAASISISNAASASASNSASLSTPTPSPTSIQSFSTTTIVGATATILRDCPSSNNSLYTVNSSGMTQQFRKVCNAIFVNAVGSDAMVMLPFATLNDCIAQCARFNFNHRSEIKLGTSPRCNSVCWRNDVTKRDRWPGGQCFGWTTSNGTTGDYQYRATEDPKLPSTICDSAVLVGFSS